MPPKYIQHENGQFYPVDDQGNIIYTGEAASGDGVLTREVTTGRMVNDPSTERTVYGVSGYGDLTGFKSFSGTRKERRKSINNLIGKRNSLTVYEKMLGLGDLRRRDFRNEEFVQDLANRQYTASDFDGIAKTQAKGDKYAQEMAQYVQGVAYPKLRHKTSKGYFSGTTNPLKVWYLQGAACPTCPGKIGKPSWKQKTIGYAKGVEWNKPGYSYTEGNVSSATEYDQMPEMTTQYAAPVKLIDRSSVESRDLNTSTPPTTTTTTRTLRSKASGSRSKGTGSKIRQTSSTNTATRPVNTTQQRTTTWQELPDGTKVNLVVGDWTNTNT